MYSIISVIALNCHLDFQVLVFFFLINKYFIKKREKGYNGIYKAGKKRRLKQNRYQAFLLQNGQKLNENPSTTRKVLNE